MSCWMDIVYLTKQDRLDHDSARQAGALSQREIEITPAIREAERLLASWDVGGDVTYREMAIILQGVLCAPNPQRPS